MSEPLVDSDIIYAPTTRNEQQQEPPLTNGNPNNVDTAWFPALRSKLSSFSMSDWLVSLGLSKRRSSTDQTEERLTVSAPTTREPSMEPANTMTMFQQNMMRDDSSEFLGPIVDDDLLTPIVENSDGTPRGGDPFESPNFWLNLEPGRSYMDTLELQHFGPLEDLVPVGQKHLGKGHEFHVTQLVNPTWCDKCGDFIWGFYKQAVRCKLAGQRPPSLYDVMKEDTLIPDSGRRTITSFFLPRNTVKTVHITSHTTVRELIVSLLKKFKVADNPLKFALYERQEMDYGQTIKAKLRRLADDVCPLRLQLLWGTESGRQLVLQENETGDILVTSNGELKFQWDAFEIPELNNFLKILELEEQQYIWQIRQKYNLYRHYVELELRTKKGEDEEASAAPRDARSLSSPGTGSDRSNGVIWKEQEDQPTMKVSDLSSSGHLECTCQNPENQTEWETFGTV